MSSLIGVYGAAGCGRGILPLLRARAMREGARLVFIDDGRAGETVNGHDVMAFDAFRAADHDKKSAALALADGRLRARLHEALVEAGIKLIGARADGVEAMDDVEIGAGALLSPHVTMTSNIRIGCAFHANLYSYIEHDCVIGDYVTLAPRASLNGNVRVGDFAYIGAGALIRQGLKIGEGAVIGMGAVVVKDVPAGMTVVGNPARRMEDR